MKINSMSKKSKIYSLIKLLWGFCIIGCCVLRKASVEANAANYTVGYPEYAKKGTTIGVEILMGENPGITTLGMRVVYDKRLKFLRAEWGAGVYKSNSCQVLVSDVEYKDNRAVNLALIDTGTFVDNGRIVIVYFKVLADYSECPIAFELRDMTDKEGPAIDGQVYYSFVQSDEDTIAVGLWIALLLFAFVAIACVYIRRQIRKERKNELVTLVGKNLKTDDKKRMLGKQEALRDIQKIEMILSKVDMNRKSEVDRLYDRMIKYNKNVFESKIGWIFTEELQRCTLRNEKRHLKSSLLFVIEMVCFVFAGIIIGMIFFK